MTADPLIPVHYSATVRSWPPHEQGGRARYMPASQAFTRRHSFDAHTQCFSLPAIARRLSTQALLDPTHCARIIELGGIPMHLFMADADAHDLEGADLERWWAEERVKVALLNMRHPGCFAYRSRGGYRIAYRLDPPIVLYGPDGAARWTDTYIAWINYLADDFGIKADELGDWPREFRLPLVTRDDVPPPKSVETVGDPAAIGVWAPSVRVTRATSTKRSKKVRTSPVATTGPAATCWLARAFKHAGWTVEAHSMADRVIVRCPWESLHAGGKGGRGSETSTIIYAPSKENPRGRFYCSHTWHGRRSLADVIDALPVEACAKATADQFNDEHAEQREETNGAAHQHEEHATR